MIHIDELTYGNIGGGLFDGKLAVLLELGDTRAVDVRRLSSTILRFGRTKIVRLSGNARESTSDDLSTLVRVLRENLYIVIGVVDGSSNPPWTGDLSYKAVNITEGEWLMGAANEIHYRPIVKVNIPSPALTDIHSRSTLYIDVDRDITATEMFDFICRNPLWRVYSPPSKAYRMTIKIEEES